MPKITVTTDQGDLVEQFDVSRYERAGDAALAEEVIEAVEQARHREAPTDEHVNRPDDRLVLSVPDSAWQANDMLDDPRSVLHAKLAINGLFMHLEAWAVEDNEDEMPRQTTVNPECAEEFDSLCVAVRVDTAFQTTTIAGREYVLVATPHNV